MTKQAAHVDSIDLLVVDVESSLGELLLPGIKALQVAFIVAHKAALQHTPLVHSFIHSFVRLFVRSFIHSFIHSLIHPSIHSFIHAFTMCLALRSGTYNFV